MDIGGLFILILFVLPLIVVAIPVTIIVYGVAKGKKRLVVVTSCITLAFGAFVGLFFLIFPTHFPYVDSWIYGKSADEIVRVYGEPDFHSEGYKMGYIVGKDNGFLGSMLDEYYYIKFDENGYAYEVSVGIQPGG